MVILVNHLANFLTRILPKKREEISIQKGAFHRECTFFCKLFCMDKLHIIGIAASAGTAFSLLPQLIKLCREKKADDLSLPMLGILFAGVALWIWYGVLKNDLIIIISNAISLALNAAIVFFSIRYKKD